MFEVLGREPVKRVGLEDFTSKSGGYQSFAVDKVGNASHELWR